MEKKNIHQQHRQRVRQRYLSGGIDSMPEHNIVEFLLFYCVPYKDTNAMAHDLIDKFGDINGILDAPIEELQKINGIGENASVMLKLMHDICCKYNKNRISRKTTIDDGDELEEFLAAKYYGESREIVYVIGVDSRGSVTKCIKVCEGSPDSATVDKRMIAEAALSSGTSSIILVHNHPGGFAAPSTADVITTRELITLLKELSVNLIDHVIVADDGCYSMAKSKKHSYLFM